MTRSVLALDYPHYIEPSEVQHVLDGDGGDRIVAVGVAASLQRRVEWRRLAEQLGKLGVEIRWEGGTAGWEARLYRAGDQLAPQIEAPPGGHDAARRGTGILREVPEGTGDQGPAADEDEVRETGDERDVPGVRDGHVPDRGGELVRWGAPGYVWPSDGPGGANLIDLDERPGPDEASALALERWEAPPTEPETDPAAHGPAPPPAVTPPDSALPPAGGVTASTAAPAMGFDNATQQWIGRMSAEGLSTRKIAAQLAEHGITASHMKIARFLRRADR